MAHDNAFFKPNSRASRIRRLIRGRLVHESPCCPVAIAARTYARTHSRSQRRAPKRRLISQVRDGVYSAGFSVGKAMLKGTHRCTVRVSSCWPVIAFHIFPPPLLFLRQGCIVVRGGRGLSLSSVSVSHYQCFASTTNKHGRGTAPLVPRASCPQ